MIKILTVTLTNNIILVLGVSLLLAPSIVIPRQVLADDDVPKTLSGKIEQVLDDDELRISTAQGYYKLDLPDSCKGAVLSGKLKVGMTIIAKGMLDPEDRELEVSTIKQGNRQICP
ncbi:hypothetical protein L3556_15100 [Candidatus Synechococcus calcipolaris G9]|uniref:DUF5666 domain-containing protein n=1 Tax=Candidatus Synechococcus calcipolaris G9 TaxID=1497997 RepID=A0ABT6F309_9SYNE|nr:hypothetical protein [Candidatus Synechococcus calcipolaris]MDG2992245.1 hypothetical protein [Candidatus Synechococcus calcipolaris G9]